MIHPKMRHIYVGIDSHKDSHTAVFLDCFYDKLGELTFENLPSKFPAFLDNAFKFQTEETTLLFGLEDISAYGRLLTAFLTDNGQQVKHVNALLVSYERKNQNITQKTDSVDAECAARVLLSKLDELPFAVPQDKFWVLRTLVVRRDFIVKYNMSLKNHLHSFLTQHYPNYRKFFANLDCDTSFAFFMNYPSPDILKLATIDELKRFINKHSRGTLPPEKAEFIYNSIEDTKVEFQEFRNATVQSTIRQIEFNLNELERLETTLAVFLKKFDCTLTSMTGISTVTAAQMLSCIGDIKRFSSPAKLARYCGVAPVTYGSGKKEHHFANQRGNRELNSLFFKLAVRLSFTVGCTNKVINPFFHDYYNRKISEGKTKRQALKCVQRRLVNIVWTMLTYNEDYVNPPMFDLPKEKHEQMEIIS